MIVFDPTNNEVLREISVTTMKIALGVGEVNAQLATLIGLTNVLIAQGVITPAMATAVTSAIAATGAPLKMFLLMAAGSPAVPAVEAVGQAEGMAANTGDPRFYSQILAGGASSCTSDATAAGALLMAKCTELHNLRTYRALHSGKYQAALIALATATELLAAVPPVSNADIHLKNQGFNTIRTIQQQIGEIYRAQQDYFQARIEVTQEVRQALAQKKSGKSRPGGLFGAAMTTAAKALFNMARQAAMP